MVKDIITIFNKKLAVKRPLLLPNCEGSHSVRIIIAVWSKKVINAACRIKMWYTSIVRYGAFQAPSLIMEEYLLSIRSCGSIPQKIILP